jgi:hypothetical protein
LAFALQRLGQPAEALKSLRDGDQLGSQVPGWPYPSAEWVKRGEVMATLLKKLPAIVKGEKKPAAWRRPGVAPSFSGRLCGGSQAGCDTGEESAKLSDAERARWRGQTLTWLKADLAAWTRRLEKASAKERGEIASLLQRWQYDPALTGVRDEAALEKMPNEVRETWRQLWQEVDGLRRQALRL